MKYVKKIIQIIIWLFLLIILSFNIYNYVSIKILHKDLTSINGYAILEVVSGSMEDTISVGDLIIINENDKSYDISDIVTFKDENDSFVTHRIIDKDDNGYITKGDNNDSKDQGYIKEEDIVGKYAFKLAKMGLIFSSLKNPITMILIFIIGIVVCIFISTDKNMKPVDVDINDEEFILYLKNKNKKENKDKLNEDKDHEKYAKKDDLKKVNEETNITKKEVKKNANNKNKKKRKKKSKRRK